MNDLTGQRFTRLLVKSYAGNGNWNCVCDCGKTKVVYAGNLRGSGKGKTKSCGCLKSEILSGQTGPESRSFKHGHNGYKGRKTTPTYNSWQSAKGRCDKSNHHAFKNYGGRGITFCERWRGEHGFENFLADMGERPKGKTLDRYPDNDGNYEPGNCRWATSREQLLNNRRTRKLAA